MTSKPQKLTGSEYQQLQEALLSAYTTETSLEQMVRFELEESLDAIAGGQNLSARVFDLIKWAEAQGRIEELTQGACTQNPGNTELQKFVQGRESGPFHPGRQRATEQPVLSSDEPLHIFLTRRSGTALRKIGIMQRGRAKLVELLTQGRQWLNLWFRPEPLPTNWDKLMLHIHTAPSSAQTA